jgi:Sulfotransferase family
LKYIQKNNSFYNLINLLTYRWVLFNSSVNRAEKLTVEETISPLWITGLFRSGTTITTKILSEMGFSIGPDQHLLKDYGSRASWNPGGFYENYLFMDWSLSIFDGLDSWGHVPPSEEEVRNYNPNQINYEKYLYQTIVQIHDDRISNFNKANLLKRYFPGNINAYLREQFKTPIAVKNPHFSVLSELLLKYWPNGRFLVVFRNPDATISSANKVAVTTDYTLYIDYYSRLLEKPNIEVTYFSYDELVAHPQESIKALANNFKLNKPSDSVFKMVKPELYRHKQELQYGNWPEELKIMYSKMQEKAINKS